MIGFVLQSRSKGDTEAGALMFGSLYSILIKYQLRCQVSNAGTDVLCVVCVCVVCGVCVRARCGVITSTVSFSGGSRQILLGGPRRGQCLTRGAH